MGEVEKIAFNRLKYNPETGVIVWSIARQDIRAGAVAGTIDTNGYRKIMLNRRYYGAHRIAWLLTYGAWPDGIIDHIDGDQSNNRLSNLRLSNTSLNAANKKRPSTNTSGFKGASLIKSTGKYGAYIKVNGKSMALGTKFLTPKEAHDAYINAARIHFGEHARSVQEAAIATLDDILTAQKNGVIAINNLNQTWTNYLIQTSGQYTSAEITSTTLLYSGAGTLVRVSVIQAGSTTGFIYDYNSAAVAITGLRILAIPNTLGIVNAGIAFTSGLVIVPGTGQSLVISYSQN